MQKCIDVMKKTHHRQRDYHLRKSKYGKQEQIAKFHMENAMSVQNEWFIDENSNPQDGEYEWCFIEDLTK